MELSKDDGKIVSITRVERDLDNGNNEGDISLMTMPTSDFEMTVVAQEIRVELLH